MNDRNHTSRGRYEAPKQQKPKRRLRWRKQFVLLCSIVALLVGVVGGSIAYLTTATDPVENKFEPGKVACQINEKMENNVKSDVKVQNTGNTDAYIRARIVVTWQDRQGNVYAKPPVAGTDYSITIKTDTGWAKNGEYYYYTSSVTPEGETGILISSCSPVSGKAPSGYTLHVEILADAIQSKGVDENGQSPVEQAWGLDPSKLVTTEENG